MVPSFRTNFARCIAVLALLLPSAAVAAAGGFDVEIATRAYLDTLQGAAREQSDAYFEGGYWLILWGALVALAVDFVLLQGRLSHRFRIWAERVTKRVWLVPGLTAIPYALAGFILTLPWTIYTDFFREQKYGLMSQSMGEWFGELAVSFAINLVIFPLLVMAIYAVIRRRPKSWWIWGTGITGIFIVIGVVLAPVYIAPLFNTYTELEPGPVRDRIVAMAEAENVPAEHIYVFDASKQTKRVSANVSGLGPTIRISLNDNLLERTSPPEIAAVMGHELGHYVLGHVWQLLIGLTLLIGASLFLSARFAPRLIARYGEKWGVRDIADPASMPVLGICLTLFFFAATPLFNTLIRVNESQADAFGLDAAKEPDGFARAAMRLSEYRKIEPGPLEEIIFYDHPSGATRVRMSMQWKADNVPGAVMVKPQPLAQE